MVLNIETPDQIAAMSRVIESLGTGGFSAQLLQLLDALLPIDHLAVIHMEAHDRVRFIGSASQNSVIIPESTQLIYLTSYSCFDPNREQLEAWETSNGPCVKRLHVNEIAQIPYRELWYQHIGVIDRLSVLTHADQGLYCLNLYRTQTPFDDTHIEQLQSLQTLLSALILKHSRYSGSLPPFLTREQQLLELIERMQSVEPKLTDRELQVCGRILIGMTSKGIALDLDVKTETVLTYRKRAYAKLEISSQNDLFLLCLVGRSPRGVEPGQLNPPDTDPL